MARGEVETTGTAIAELTTQESALTLANVVMGYAVSHYDLRGWDHIVECYTVSELAESIQGLIDLNCPDIPMATGADAITWWDGICDAVHENRRAAEIAFCW